MPGKLHNDLVASLPGARTKRLRKGLAELLTAEYAAQGAHDDITPADEAREMVETLLGPFPLIPDAWAYEVVNGLPVLTLFEVEVTSWLTPDKLAVYGDLWARADCYGWEIVLVRVNRWGAHVEDTMRHYYESVLGTARPANDNGAP